LLVIIVILAGIFYYNKMIADKYEGMSSNTLPIQKKDLTKDFDASILETEKFKELKEIPLKEKTSGLTEEDLSIDELAQLKLMARYGNPFAPF